MNARYYYNHYNNRYNVTESLDLVPDAHQEIRPSTWFLTEDYQRFSHEESLEWVPDLDYYVRIIGRLVDSIFWLFGY